MDCIGFDFEAKSIGNTTPPKKKTKNEKKTIFYLNLKLKWKSAGRRKGKIWGVGGKPCRTFSSQKKKKKENVIADEIAFCPFVPNTNRTEKYNYTQVGT